MTIGQPFEDSRDVEVPANPEEVWAAIATGPGIDSWFMGRNVVRSGADGTVQTEFGDYKPELEVTAWDPPRRFGYRGDTEPDGRFMAYEFLVEGRAGGSAVLRAVTSGFIPGDDWTDEYEAMKLGGELFFSTLVEYLTWFRGRFALPVTAFGPPATGWERDRERLLRALGLSVGATAGSPCRVAVDEARPVDGVVYFTNHSTVGVRTADAFYRFMQGFGHPVVAAHQLFAPGEDPDRAARAWGSWLARVLDPKGD